MERDSLEGLVMSATLRGVHLGALSAVILCWGMPGVPGVAARAQVSTKVEEEQRGPACGTARALAGGLELRSFSPPRPDLPGSAG